MSYKTTRTRKLPLLITSAALSTFSLLLVFLSTHSPDSGKEAKTKLLLFLAGSSSVVTFELLGQYLSERQKLNRKLNQAINGKASNSEISEKPLQVTPLEEESNEVSKLHSTVKWKVISSKRRIFLIAGLAVLGFSAVLLSHESISQVSMPEDYPEQRVSSSIFMPAQFNAQRAAEETSVRQGNGGEYFIQSHDGEYYGQEASTLRLHEATPGTLILRSENAMPEASILWPENAMEGEQECIVLINSASVPLRSTPGTSGIELARVVPGAYTVLDFSRNRVADPTHDWLQIEVQGSKGWVRDDAQTIDARTIYCS